MSVGIYKKTAKDIMTKDVTTIRTQDTIHDALLLLAENRIQAIPVVDRVGECVGMISQSDIIAEARERDLEDSEANYSGLARLVFSQVSLEEITNERVEDMMTDRVVVAAPDELVTDLADRMLREQIHHIPVVDGRTIVGIVSTMDILAALRTPV
jgi:CBS-domain-containing membrane protein